MPPELILYFREGCHLCEDMEQLLLELLDPGSFTLRRIDIDESPHLKEVYNVRVPVLSLLRADPADARSAVIGLDKMPADDSAPSEEVLCEHFLDLEAVKVALASYNRQLLAACSSPAE